jgi:hypothetical protein
MARRDISGTDIMLLGLHMPGPPMCQHKVNLLETPRACRRPAAPGLTVCALHADIIAKRGKIEVHQGGFCVVCAAPARSYDFGTARIALCRPHGIVLSRAIREGR